MKITVSVLMMVLMSVAVSAQELDANRCGNEFLQWKMNANSIRSNMYESIGRQAMGEGEGVRESAIEMYLKSCGYAARMVRPGGCYDITSKKVVFPSTVESDCAAFVQKVRDFQTSVTAPRN